MVIDASSVHANAGNWSHHCTACGKCCNSPPQMTLPELFHHQHRFIGALAIRRVSPPSQPAAADFAQLADRLLHRAGQTHLALLTQAIDYPTLNRCPALMEDGRCAVHDNGKPRACTVVPLDALLPDSLQHAVLARRAAGGAEYIGEDCIVAAVHADGSSPEGLRALTRGAELIDPVARQHLDAHRHELATDKRFWGEAVFAELRRDVLERSSGLANIPASGALNLPLAPVITALAAVSNACRQRCIEYLEAQRTLMEDSVERALQRKLPAERAFTAQLRNFIAITIRLLLALQQQTLTSRAANADEIETWLGASAGMQTTQPVAFAAIAP